MKIISDERIEAKRFSSFFEKLGTCKAKALRDLDKKFAKNPSRALELAGDLTVNAATKKTKTIAATAPSLIKIIQHVKGFCLGTLTTH